MHTDQSWAEDYKDEISEEMIKEIHKILAGENESKIEAFIVQIRHPVSMLRASLRVHGNIPTAKDINRYTTRVKNNIGLTQKYLTDLSELLNDAPFELTRKARAANIPVEKLSRELVGLSMLLNDFELPKSKMRPEVKNAVEDIAREFESSFGTTPSINAFREQGDIKLEGPISERFTPLLATLLNRTIDYSYRLAKEILPS